MKMDIPICDFVRGYVRQDALRLHMPGHKGHGSLGFEKWDITEIEGADALYEANGIIRKSEENASELFGCPTFYSTEGSSQCIRAMLFLVSLYARKNGKRPLVAAFRNVHKTFLSAAALLDLEILWLFPEKQDSYLSCGLDAAALDGLLTNTAEKPAALYVTSPDYLGNIADIRAIAEVAHKHGALLVVDNAHGAYLRFLRPSWYPIDLGADLCCDSAHKTLPVLTGGAYLHISSRAPGMLAGEAKRALAMFGSTSPSYLILQSLDAANANLAQGYTGRLTVIAEELAQLKNRLTDRGYTLTGDEPLKLTIRTKPYGYYGQDLARVLRTENIVCEFADPDYVVMMLTPESGSQGIARLETALDKIPRREHIREPKPRLPNCQLVLSVREAMLAASRVVPAEESEGRILAAPSVGCPPAVPIVVCGERINEAAVRCFAYYGIETCSVVAED